MDVINQGISIASKEEGFHQRSQFMKKLLIGLTTIIVTLPLIAQTTMGSGINPSPSATGSGLGTGVGTGNTSTPDSPVGGRPTTNPSLDRGNDFPTTDSQQRMEDNNFGRTGIDTTDSGTDTDPGIGTGVGTGTGIGTGTDVNTNPNIGTPPMDTGAGQGTNLNNGSGTIAPSTGTEDDF